MEAEAPQANKQRLSQEPPIRDIPRKGLQKCHTCFEKALLVVEKWLAYSKKHDLPGAPAIGAKGLGVDHSIYNPRLL